MSLLKPNSRHPARVMIFIDGGYLRKWFEKKGFGKENLPLGRFSLLITKIALHDLNNAIIIRSYFYDAIVDHSDPRYEYQKKFFQGIDLYPNYDVRLGRLVKTSNGSIRQKGVDVLMAIDMVNKSNLDQYDVAIVVAGDLDHIEAVKTVKSNGKQVFGIWYEPSTSEELRSSFDEDHELSNADVELLTDPIDDMPYPTRF